MQRVELLAVPALPVPGADLVRGEPLRLEAGIELAAVLDQHQLQILAGVVLAVGPVGAFVERIDLHVDADLRQVGLHDRGGRLRHRIVEHGELGGEAAALPGFLEQRLGALDVALVLGRVLPVAEDARRLQRIGRLDGAIIGGGDDGRDVQRLARRLPDLHVVPRLLLDVGADPHIVDRRQLLGLDAGGAGDVLRYDRIDAGKVDLARLQGQLRRLVVGDRLADDLREERLLAQIVGVGGEREVVARDILLENIGAGADRRRLELVAQALERLLGDDHPRPVGQRDQPDGRRRALQMDLAGQRPGDLDLVERRPVVGVIDLLAVRPRQEALERELHVLGGQRPVVAAELQAFLQLELDQRVADLGDLLGGVVLPLGRAGLELHQPLADRQDDVDVDRPAAIRRIEVLRGPRPPAPPGGCRRHGRHSPTASPERSRPRRRCRPEILFASVRSPSCGPFWKRGGGRDGTPSRPSLRQPAIGSQETASDKTISKGARVFLISPRRQEWFSRRVAARSCGLQFASGRIFGQARRPATPSAPHGHPRQRHLPAPGSHRPDRMDHARRRHPARRHALAARRRPGAAGAGDPRIPALSPTRRDGAARQADARLFRRPRLRRRPRRHPRLRRLRRPAARRIPAAGAERRGRGDRLARRPALVQRRGRHDGHLLGRLQRPAGRRPSPAGAEGHHHLLLDRRPLRRRLPLHGRLPARQHHRLGLDHVRLRRLAARPRSGRRPLARHVAGPPGEQSADAGGLDRPPDPRRLLEAGLGGRGLRGHHRRRLRGRRLGRRLLQRDPPPAFRAVGAAQGPDRSLGARLSEHRAPRTSDRLPAGGAALVGPLAERPRHRHHGRADAARLDAGKRAADHLLRRAAGPLGRRSPVAADRAAAARLPPDPARPRRASRRGRGVRRRLQPGDRRHLWRMVPLRHARRVAGRPAAGRRPLRRLRQPAARRTAGDPRRAAPHRCGSSRTGRRR